MPLDASCKGWFKTVALGAAGFWTALYTVHVLFRPAAGLGYDL